MYRHKKIMFFVKYKAFVFEELMVFAIAIKFWILYYKRGVIVIN